MIQPVMGKMLIIMFYTQRGRSLHNYFDCGFLHLPGQNKGLKAGVTTRLGT